MFTSSSTKYVWGIYVGEDGISAIRVRKKSRKLLIDAFDTITYAEIDDQSDNVTSGLPTNQQFTPFSSGKTTTSAPTSIAHINDLSAQARKAIGLFVSKNRLSSLDRVIVALPSQFILSRFVRLPPIKRSQMKNIVRFEVEKNIPVDINEIVWDFHPTGHQSTPDGKIEVGIFAIKNDDIHTFLTSIEPLKDNLSAVQAGSIAFYNYIFFSEREIQPTLLLEIGTDNTTLMIMSNERIWIRNIFSVDVDAYFVNEIKRSTDYHKSIVGNLDIEYLIVTGASSQQEDTKRYIAENLGYKLKEPALPDDRIEIAESVNNEKLTDNIAKAIIPLGLAVQGVSKCKVSLNLMPAIFHETADLSATKKIALFASLAILAGVLILAFGRQIQNNQLSLVLETGLETLNKATLLHKRYNEKEEVYSKAMQKLDQIGLTGEGRAFWSTAIPIIFDAVPEDVIVSSIVTTPPNAEKTALVISLKGKSLNPRYGFINDNIKTSFENALFAYDNNKEDGGGERPVFTNVDVINESIQHNKGGITFEIKCTIDYATFLLISRSGGRKPPAETDIEQKG